MNSTDLARINYGSVCGQLSLDFLCAQQIVRYEEKELSISNFSYTSKWHFFIFRSSYSRNCASARNTHLFFYYFFLPFVHRIRRMEIVINDESSMTAHNLSNSPVHFTDLLLWSIVAISEREHRALSSIYALSLQAEWARDKALWRGSDIVWPISSLCPLSSQSDRASDHWIWVRS